MTEPRDPALDVLLDLDGQVLVLDPRRSGERDRITPKVMHDRVELDLPPTPPRKAS